MIEESKMNAALKAAKKDGTIKTLAEAEVFKMACKTAVKSYDSCGDYIGKGISGKKIQQ